jgi:hypothetical protein
MRRRRPWSRLALSACTLAWLIAACGARTGLDVILPPDASAPPDRDALADTARTPDATQDVTLDVAPDVTPDVLVDVEPDIVPDVSIDTTPIIEGGALDVTLDDCNTLSYCVASDPGYIYQCGVRIFQCSSLEQCESPCGDAGDCNAECINPCLNSLGQNTSNGCEFYAVEMDTTQEVAGVCYAVFVVNQWQTGQPARLEVDQGGTVLPIEQFARIPSGTGTNITYSQFFEAQGLAQNQIAILFLSRDPADLTDPNTSDPRFIASCPPGVTPAIVGDAALHGTGVGTAFHLRSNVPIVAYQMLPYGGGSARVTGATLLLPTNVWGTNYVAANAYAAPSVLITEPFGSIPGPTLVVIAQQDNTNITINPVVDILAGGGLAGTTANVPVTYNVNQGEYVQITQSTELTGSAIQADAPVAVIGGSTLLDVPITNSRADTAEQMLPPIQALGNVYVAVRYRSRSPTGEESVPWRVVGTVNGTNLTFDPPQAGAPATLSAGELVEFDETGPFVVSSQDAQHPFYMAQYMTGGQDYPTPDASTDGTGDPEFVNVITPAQYLPSYTFFTDPTYPETNLVIVRALDPSTSTFPDVILDCAGTLTGWTPVGTSGTFQFTRVDLSTGNFQGVNGCNNGVHTITGAIANAPSAAARFGVTVWGWGSFVTDPSNDMTSPTFTQWVSYGYPAGVNITQLNNVVFSAQ